MAPESRTHAKNGKDIWRHIGYGLSKEDMDRRIGAAVSQRGWKEVVRIFAERGMPIDALKVAEVGCGTGTMALTFGLMGSAVTLIDNNSDVLDRAEEMHGRYGRRPHLVKADCLGEPPAGLEETFDLVISVGLAEHFKGDERRRCIEYHRRLAKKGGVAFITTPNGWNMPYWSIRAVRALTRTWTIDVEVPFSAPELRRLAREAGFMDCYVIGYVGFWRDISDNLRGFGYALMDALPRGWVDAVKGWMGRMKKSPPVRSQTKEEMEAYCRRMAQAAKEDLRARAMPGFADIFVSEVALIAFK